MELSNPAADLQCIGYRAPTAAKIVGITYRQLDYWTRTGLVIPSLRAAAGSGVDRLYSFGDIVLLRVIKRLLDTGVSLQKVRLAVQELRQAGVDIADSTLVSDGESVHVTAELGEVLRLLRGGRAVFVIALEPIWNELNQELAAAGVVEQPLTDVVETRELA